MKPEAALWKAVRDKMVLPGDRMDRVENSVLSGQPDTNGCLEGEDVWIELKAPREPKRASTLLMTSNGNHPLMLSQINWMVRQRQAKGLAFILVRTDRVMMLVDGTEHADNFNKWTVSEMMHNSIISFALPMKQDDWRLLRNVIFTTSRHRRLHHHSQSLITLRDMERGALAGGGESGRRAELAPGRKPEGGIAGSRGRSRKGSES